MRLPELLSPAGGMEQLRAAVENGADAVYMGGKLFNARQSAANFDGDELKGALDYAHARGVNIYITMNTLIGEGEMQAACDAACGMYEAGADALIVQDLGFAALLRRHLPDLPLHLSTQGTVYSLPGIRALEPLGFRRVILARELSLAEIGAVAAASPVPVEVFAHGALCVCTSGQCLMSSLIGGRSGNRGRCAQPCRLPYALEGGRGYLLSPKDLCTLPLLPALAASGVAALKIEGRMKSAEYVAVVTSVYRRHLDRCLEAGYVVEGQDREALLQVFNRGGFTAGYLEGKPGAELIARDRPKHWGVPIGAVRAYDGARGLVTARLTGRLATGDGVEIAGEGFPGNIVTYIAAGGRQVESAEGGDVVFGTVRGAVRPGDAVYRTSDKALNDRARATFTGRPLRKVPLHGRFTAAVGQPMLLELWDDRGNRAAERSPAPAEEAVSRPLAAEVAREQLSRTGDTPFELADCAVEVDGRAAAPLSALNALRRAALARMEALRADRYPGRRASFAVGGDSGERRPVTPRLSLYLYRWRPELAEVLPLADRVYLPFAAFAEGTVRLRGQPAELLPWLPAATHGSFDRLIVRHVAEMADWGVGGVLAGNPAHFKQMESAGLPVYADASFNAYNGWTVAELAALGAAGVALSPELTMEQIEELPAPPVALEAAVFGRQRAMTSAYCPVGAEHGRRGGRPCGACAGGGAFFLTDRVGARFPVLCNPVDCRSDILNADTLAVPGLAQRLGRAGVSLLRISVFDEPADEVVRVIGLLRRAIAGERVEELSGKGYTRGHYFRGV